MENRGWKGTRLGLCRMESEAKRQVLPKKQYNFTAIRGAWAVNDNPDIFSSNSVSSILELSMEASNFSGKGPLRLASKDRAP